MTILTELLLFLNYPDNTVSVSDREFYKLGNDPACGEGGVMVLNNPTVGEGSQPFPVAFS